MPLIYSSNLKNKGRKLRSNQTDAEKLLWQKIRREQINKLQFNRQKPIGRYIVDFYCDKAKLVIEIDGGQHYEEANLVNDRKRDEYLRSFGLKVVRFTNIDVLKNIESVVNKIAEITKIPPSLPF